MDAFPFTRCGPCRTIDLLARRIGLSRDGTRAPMQVRNGRRPHGRLLGQPAALSKNGRFLSKQPGPPHRVTAIVNSTYPFSLLPRAVMNETSMNRNQSIAM